MALVVAVAALTGAAAAVPIGVVVADHQVDAATRTVQDADTVAGDGQSPAMTTSGSDTQATSLFDARTVAEAVIPSVLRVDVAGAAGQGSGSGVAWSSDGIVVTNNHVVTGATTVTVTTPDGATHDAAVLGTYEPADLAVLRIDAELTPIDVATRQVALGEQVLAVGSPFGLDGSVTSGIVSATGRTVASEASTLLNLIQTDAAINPGNSGGALVNANGRLVGINTVIATSGGGSDGIGFAIDADTVSDVVDDLLDDGTVTQPVLGVRGATATSEAGGVGAWVASVTPGSAADEAGLAEGDVIVAIDGEPVATFEELAGRIARMEPDQQVTLSVQRSGGSEPVEVEVVLDASQ